MSRWIDADKYMSVLDILADKMTDSGAIVLNQAKTICESVPSIDIVRCGECKHYVAETDSGDGREWSSCEYWLREINDDDYCSYGERKDI